jgi:hypothetical protein
VWKSYEREPREVFSGYRVSNAEREVRTAGIEPENELWSRYLWDIKIKISNEQEMDYGSLLRYRTVKLCSLAKFDEIGPTISLLLKILQQSEKITNIHYCGCLDTFAARWSDCKSRMRWFLSDYYLQDFLFQSTNII